MAGAGCDGGTGGRVGVGVVGDIGRMASCDDPATSGARPNQDQNGAGRYPSFCPFYESEARLARQAIDPMDRWQSIPALRISKQRCYPAWNRRAISGTD